MKDAVLSIPVWDLSIARMLSTASAELKKSREKSGKKYLGIFLANELTTTVEALATCGLQRDINKKISDGIFSYNSHWTGEFGTSSTFISKKLITGSSPVARQLDVIFKSHGILIYNIILIRLSEKDRIIYLEASREESPSYFSQFGQQELLMISEKFYLSHLKTYQSTHISDWEKAVHELASPLDFIYSNSDYILYYMSRADLPEDKKKKKIEDLKKVAQLLINRLHQYRFAFAGVANMELKIDSVNLMDALMPITHLFYHDAGNKGLKFKYDELRDITVYSDQETIQFIGFNLISNAIKYSSKGTQIELYAYRNNKSISFGVRNVGIQIPADEQLKIFGLGYRTEAARKSDARGLGVGLDVCKKLAKELGGSIRLLDGSGNKTTFEVEVPDIPRSHS